MPRINPTVNKEAYEIYEKLDRNDRGPAVSQAIIEWKQRKKSYITQEELELYLLNNLLISTTQKSGSYGSKDYILIELKLGDKVISECYIDK